MCEARKGRRAALRLLPALSLLVGSAGCGVDFDGVDAEEAREEEYIFDPSEFHHFELEVDPADWEWLKENALREEWVPATLVFEGERYPDAAVRFKGAYGTLVSCFDEETGEQIFDTSAETCEPIPFCEYWEEEECDADTEDVFLLMPQCDRLYGFTHRATWERYLEALRDLVEGPMARAKLLSFADAQREKIRDAVAEDPYGPGLETFEEENVWLDETITDQIYAIEQLLADSEM